MFVVIMCVFFTVCVLYTQGMGNKEWREVSVYRIDSYYVALSDTKFYVKCTIVLQFCSIFYTLIHNKHFFFFVLVETTSSLTTPCLRACMHSVCNCTFITIVFYCSNYSYM